MGENSPMGKSGSADTSSSKLTLLFADGSTMKDSSLPSAGCGRATLAFNTALMLRMDSLTRSFSSAFFPVMGTPNFLQALRSLAQAGLAPRRICGKPSSSPPRPLLWTSCYLGPAAF